MAVTLVSLVNQRIAYARVLLDKAQSTSASAPLLERALHDSCLFQLTCAFGHYLREICQYYGVKNLDTVHSLSDARRILSERDTRCAEIDELAALADSNSSWLAGLLAAFDSCWDLPRAIDDPKFLDASTDSLISVVNLGESEALMVTPAFLADCIDNLAALIERHRESTVEY